MSSLRIIFKRTCHNLGVGEVAVIVGPRGAHVSHDGADLAKLGQVDKAKALRQRRRRRNRQEQHKPDEARLLV